MCIEKKYHLSGCLGGKSALQHNKREREREETKIEWNRLELSVGDFYGSYEANNKPYRFIASGILKPHCVLYPVSIALQGY